jgi:hypothetical protein
MLTDLPTETLFQILIELSHLDLISIRPVCKMFRDLRHDVYFWAEKASHDLNIRKSQFHRSSQVPPDPQNNSTLVKTAEYRYIELLTRLGYVTVGSEVFIEAKRCLLRAIRRAYVCWLTSSQDGALIRYFEQQLIDSPYIWVSARNEASMHRRDTLVTKYIEKLFTPEWCDNNMECLAIIGHSEAIATYHQTHSISPNHILTGAAIGGHLDLVNLALAQGADNIVVGLEMAITYMHPEIVDRLLTVYSQLSPPPEEPLPLARLLKLALNSGNWKSLHYLCVEFSDRLNDILDNPLSSVQWEDFLIYGAQNNYMELINFAIDHNVTNWNSGLVAAAKANNMYLVKLFYQRGADRIDAAFAEACRNGHLEMVRYLRSLHPALNTDEGLLLAIQWDYWNIIEELLTETSTDEALITAVAKGYLDIVDLVIERIKPSPEQLERALIKATCMHHEVIMNYLIAAGADPISSLLNWIRQDPIRHHLSDLPVSMIVLLAKSDKFKWTLDLLTSLIHSPMIYSQTLLEFNLVPLYELIEVLLSQAYRSTDQEMLLKTLVQRHDLDSKILLQLASTYNNIDIMIMIHELAISRITLPSDTYPQSE